jgi:uncharacterized protein (TIGR03437 family)
MKSKVWNRFAVAFLAVLFPIVAFADVSGTLTITANSQVSMDTGTVVSSGGDFLWDGTKLTPQGSTKALNATALAGLSGATGYATLTQTVISSFAALGSSAPLTGLAANTVVGYQTNGENFGKFLVTSVTGTTLAIQYTTYISTTPTITGVQNNYSYLTPGLPNYGIAPGTIFIITGSSLASTTTVSTLQSSAPPGIPATLNGASISVTVGGVTTHPAMYYAIANQIGAVLPSNTPTGTGTITVTYNGTASNKASILVVPSALGLIAYNGSGSGLINATDLHGINFTYTNSASPGQSIILWGSGLGADTADSDTTFTSTPHAVNQPLTIYIGGIAVTPAYAGSSGYPGLNQINVTIPTSVGTGCGISVVGLSGSIVSNFVNLPIAQGGGVCNDPALGYNGTQLANGGGPSGTYTTASVGIFQSTSTPPIPGQQPEMTGVTADFQSYSGGSSSAQTSVVSLGSCFVPGPVSLSGTAPTITGLDAGTITVQGPAGSQTLTDTKNPLTGLLLGEYEAQVANSFLPATGGTFTFTATGGAQVGAFTASISLGNLLTWTNESSITSVTRASGQQVTWSGGSPNSYVYVSGNSSSTSGATATFVCYAPVSQGQLTVPNYVLLALPAGTGNLGISNGATPSTFTASGLTAPGVTIGGVTFSLGTTYN